MLRVSTQLQTSVQSADRARAGQTGVGQVDISTWQCNVCWGGLCPSGLGRWWHCSWWGEIRGLCSYNAESKAILSHRGDGASIWLSELGSDREQTSSQCEPKALCSFFSCSASSPEAGVGGLRGPIENVGLLKDKCGTEERGSQLSLTSPNQTRQAPLRATTVLLWPSFGVFNGCILGANTM